MTLDHTIYVDCPCCKARLEVLRENGKVLQHWAKPLAKDKDGDPIKAATAKMKAEKERLSKLLDGAKDALAEQRKAAMEKFEREKERIKREGDDSPPPRPFDLD
ncbi:MAG: hypothetical protein HZB91_13435 [Elusimicrobia bacterium]|nr:hypothetical protein [Elusimicrobiota bacterium]